MIAGIFHEGSGLGDQLFRYITVRTLAEKKRFEFSMISPENFKGKEFLGNSYLGINKVQSSDLYFIRWNEKDVRDSEGNDIRSFDPEINFVEDNTLIDGSFEDDKYWHHNLENISEWLKVEPLDVPNEKCLIGFRGGEYASYPELFLPPEYWKNAVKKINEVVSKELKKEGKIWAHRYEVHSDDPPTAKRVLTESTKDDLNGLITYSFIENQKISHSKHTNMAFNWRSARHAKYAIIPNSAFFILPRILKHHEDPTAITIAPRYWAGRNQKIWKRPACYYSEFTYI